MELKDLPPGLRAQAEAQLATVARAGSKRRSQHAVPVKGGRWRCATCGNEEPTLAATERHADETGHRRYDVIL